jgi:hypothetical protein
LSFNTPKPTRGLDALSKIFSELKIRKEIYKTKAG